jgi:hypothetical protein
LIFETAIISHPTRKGLSFSSFHAAQEEAARSLADLAKDAVQNGLIDGVGGNLSVEVRDDAGPLLQAHFSVIVSRK